MIQMLNGEWKDVLKSEIKSDYFLSLMSNLNVEYQNCTVFPQKDQVFRALQLVDYSKVKVCILGQDPYHGENQANGLAFAVNQGIRFPPSLLNIFKELASDIGECSFLSGTLNGWAKQGVLLLNTTLTVKKDQPQSHFGLGWERFTDFIISTLSSRQNPIVFILWGANAISKAKLIDCRHKVISSAHPSPLSAHRGFLGSKPFSKANEFLKQIGQKQINWLDLSGDKAEYYTAASSITIL